MDNNKPSLNSFGEKRPPLSSFEKKDVSTKEKIVRGVSGAAPVVGGILGGLTGAIVGAPTGPGAILTGAAGTAAGTGAGQAFGETLENLTGLQDESIADLAKESITRPVVAGAVDAATAGAMKLAQPVLKGIGGIVKGVGRIFIPKNAPVKVAVNAFKVPTAISRAVPVDDTVEEVIVRHGIHGDFDDIAKAVDSVTGSEGAISKITRNAVSKIKDQVDIGDALAMANKAKLAATNLDDKVAKNTIIQINNILNKAQKSILKVDPLDALDAERQLESVGFNLIKAASNKGGLDEIVLKQQAEMYLSAAEALSEEINKKVAKEGIVDAFKTSSVLNELSAISPRLADQFSKAKNISEIRSIARPWVNMGKIVDAARTMKSSAFINRGSSIGNLAVESLQRPEAATTVSTALQDLSESALGKVAGTVSSGVQGAANLATSTPVARGLTQILTNLGLSSSQTSPQR